MVSNFFFEKILDNTPVSNHTYVRSNYQKVFADTGLHFPILFSKRRLHIFAVQNIYFPAHEQKSLP